MITLKTYQNQTTGKFKILVVSYVIFNIFLFTFWNDQDLYLMCFSYPVRVTFVFNFFSLTGIVFWKHLKLNRITYPGHCIKVISAKFINPPPLPCPFYYTYDMFKFTATYLKNVALYRMYNRKDRVTEIGLTDLLKPGWTCPPWPSISYIPGIYL